MAQIVNQYSSPVNAEGTVPNLVVQSSSKGGQAAKDTSAELSSVILMLETLNELREELSQGNEANLEDVGDGFNQPVEAVGERGSNQGHDQGEEKQGDPKSSEHASTKGANQNGMNGPFSQITMSRTAIAVVATLKNFAMLLLTIMLENEQNKVAAQFSGNAAAANANALQQKGEDQYTGALAAGLSQCIGAGLSVAFTFAPNPAENANDDQIQMLQNQKNALVNMKTQIDLPANNLNAEAVVGQNVAARPVNPDAIRELRAGQFLDENRQIQARYATKDANGFTNKQPSALRGLQTVNNPTPRMLPGPALPEGVDGPAPVVSIEDTMAAIAYNDSLPNAQTTDAADIKVVLDRKIDSLSMEINSKAQKIGGFNGTRQALAQAFSSFGQGIGGAAQGNYQADMGQDDKESTIQTQINQQATSMVQTDQGQISNTFNLVGQTLSTLGQISTSANQ